MALEDLEKTIISTLKSNFGSDSLRELLYDQQQYSNNCLIQAIKIKLEVMLGENIDQNKFTALANQYKLWEVGEGSNIIDGKEFLDRLGVESEFFPNKELNELEIGKRYIVGLDPKEIDASTTNEIPNTPDTPGHAYEIERTPEGDIKLFNPDSQTSDPIFRKPEVVQNAREYGNDALEIKHETYQDLEQIREKLNEGLNSVEPDDIEKISWDLKSNDYDPDTLDYAKLGASESPVSIQDLPQDVQDQMHQINIDVENILATGGYIALMQFLKDNPQKQKTVTKVALALGAFDAFTDFSGDKVKLDFEINPLLITSLAYYVSQVASNAKNVKIQKFSLSFSNILSKGFRVIEYAGYAAIGIEVIEFLTNVEFTDIFLEIVDAADFLDIFGNISDVASTGIDITEGLATLGLGIALSRAVRWIFKKINKDDIIKIKNLNRKTTPKKTLAKLLESNAPVPLLMGPYCEMINEG